MRPWLRRVVLAAGGGALVLVAVVDPHGRWMPAVVVALLVGCLALALEAAIVLRRARAQQAALAVEVARNHKRASVWNHHLERALGIDRGDRPAGTDVGAADALVTVAAGGETVRRSPQHDASPVVAGRTSIVIETGADADIVVRALAGIVSSDEEPGRSREIVVVHRAPEGSERVRARAAVDAAQGTYVPLPVDVGACGALDLGISYASGDVVVLLRGGAVLRGDALRAMVGALEDDSVRAAQALAVDEDELVWGAGLARVDVRALPVRLLAGLSPDDARGLAGSRIGAVASVAAAWRTTEIRALHGFVTQPGLPVDPDDADEDLCRRAIERFGGAAVVMPHVRASVPPQQHQDTGQSAGCSVRPSPDGGDQAAAPPDLGTLLGRCGFVPAHVDPGDGRTRGPAPVLVRTGAARRRRWGILVASVPGAAGDTWGDTHFGEALRRAIVAQGEEAVVHRYSAASGGSARFDDVVLVVRGPSRMRPVAGRFNVLWVISHPEDVTAEEMSDFDLVLAASEAWSARMSLMTGRQVHVVHQATDASRFRTDVVPVRSDLPLFVGGTHVGRVRPVVDVAERAGVRIAVHGEGWGHRPARLAVHGPYIPNAELCSWYRGAPLVLADHWSPMAMEGFVQNRVFDALASGAPVVSDPVAGLHDLLGDAVRTYRSPEEFARLCDPLAADQFGSTADREEVARWVRRDHSFDRRAHDIMTLVDATERVPAWL